jgi:phytoene dehydrogenase-like protein
LDVASLIGTAGLVCGDLERASAGELADFLRQAVKAKEATGYFLGGWENLIEQLMRVIEIHGEIRTDVKVEKVLVENGVAVGALTPDGEVRGKTVVVAVPLQQIGSLLAPEHFEEKPWNAARAIEPTCGLSLDLCLSKRVSDIDGVIFTMDPPTMGVFTSNIEPAMAPRGKQLATWFYPIPRAKMGDKAFLKAERTRLNDLIEKMFPGIFGLIEYERFIAMDVVDGAVPVVGQTGPERPGGEWSRGEKVFFAGDSVGVPGQGGDIAFNAGIVCAGKVKEALKGK